MIIYKQIIYNVKILETEKNDSFPGISGSENWWLLLNVVHNFSTGENNLIIQNDI